MESNIAVNTENNQLRNQEAKLPSDSDSTATGIKPKAKSRHRNYWIAGAVVALVMFINGLFFIIAEIYVFPAPGSVFETEQYPTPAVKSNPANSVLITNQAVKDYFKTRKRVGKFNLLQVFEKRSTAYFLGAEGEAGAFYLGSGKKEDVMIDMATYANREKARTEFIETYKKETKVAARIIIDYYESEKKVTAMYQRGAILVLIFCSFGNDSPTSCYRITSPHGAALGDFYDDFFKQEKSEF